MRPGRRRVCERILLFHEVSKPPRLDPAKVEKCNNFSGLSKRRQLDCSTKSNVCTLYYGAGWARLRGCVCICSPPSHHLASPLCASARAAPLVSSCSITSRHPSHWQMFIGIHASPSESCFFWTRSRRCFSCIFQISTSSLARKAGPPRSAHGLENCKELRRSCTSCMQLTDYLPNLEEPAEEKKNRSYPVGSGLRAHMQPPSHP